MIRSDQLVAAIGVFARYGFRKTSMDDVAAAMGMSRQALYKKFSSKNELFRNLVEAQIIASKTSALNALRDDVSPVDQRLLEAFDQWTGQYVDILRASPHSAEIVDIADEQMRTLSEEAEQEILDAVAKLLGRRSRWTNDAAFSMLMAAKGLMSKARHHQEFLDGMLRVISAHLTKR